MLVQPGLGVTGGGQKGGRSRGLGGRLGTDRVLSGGWSWGATTLTVSHSQPNDLVIYSLISSPCHLAPSSRWHSRSAGEGSADDNCAQQEIAQQEVAQQEVTQRDTAQRDTARRASTQRDTAQRHTTDRVVRPTCGEAPGGEAPCDETNGPAAIPRTVGQRFTPSDGGLCGQKTLLVSV